MQNYKKTESPEKLVFVSKLETLPGGGTVAVNSLGGDRVYAGSPVRKEAGLYKICKTAKVYENASNSATSIKVDKGSLFIVGDKIGIPESCGKAITAINKSGSTSYDTITLAATLGVALSANDVIEEVSVSNDVITGFAPMGYVGETFDVEANNNHLQSIVLRGTITEANLACPITSRMKAATPLILFI